MYLADKVTFNATCMIIELGYETFFNWKKEQLILRPQYVSAI